MTLQSMLASCKRKEKPVDNDRYVLTAPDNPKKVGPLFPPDSDVSDVASSTL